MKIARIIAGGLVAFSVALVMAVGGGLTSEKAVALAADHPTDAQSMRIDWP
ncbi:hypothetical protein ACFWBV_02760 [Streptomyces sp. NPDC060030]|uniref:hypothetical protein n=1 Tax=Streptomyces sp. NPDC060030 TaxID=3347042 RepID=UPI0036AA12C7